MSPDPLFYGWDGRAPPLILALTGGGFRGYFTAMVLARIEQSIGVRCCQVFNLIAGTSIGGIIALVLAGAVRPRETPPLTGAMVRKYFRRAVSETCAACLGRPM